MIRYRPHPGKTHALTGWGVDLKILSGRFFLRYFLDRASRTLSIFQYDLKPSASDWSAASKVRHYFNSGLQNRPRTESDCGGDVEDEKEIRPKRNCRATRSDIVQVVDGPGDAPCPLSLSKSC